jgi:hypothetical protein
MNTIKKINAWLGVVLFILPIAVFSVNALAVDNPQSSSVGVQGRIPSPAPTTGATISFPKNGQVFNEVPITVTGICPNGLLVKLFKNNVFSGSAQCTKGNFSIITDLFIGQNDLVARVYDALDQAGPDSNTVSVTFVDTHQGAGSRVTLTTNYAKRGANPGETLTWPISLSGGTGPYAVSADWGDGKAADLISQEFAGNLTLSHIYDSPGVYNIIVKATDKNGTAAFLQLVGVGNGPLSQEEAQANKQIVTITKILWWPAAAMVPFLFITFWLGRRFELYALRKKIERGQRPF